MADDKTKTGEPDRSRVAGDEEYEIRDFAEVAGIPIERARQLVKEHGNDRETLMKAARSAGGPEKA